jgi:hypothetical protein
MVVFSCCLLIYVCLRVRRVLVSLHMPALVMCVSLRNRAAVRVLHAEACVHRSLAYQLACGSLAGMSCCCSSCSRAAGDSFWFEYSMSRQFSLESAHACVCVL